jgi:hypothetical protein
MSIERVDTVVSHQADPFLLLGTGFNLQGQIEMVRKAAGEYSDQESWKEFLTETSVSDLEALYYEYLAHQEILPFQLQFDNSRVVCERYGNKPLVDITSEAERDGTIKAVTRELEQQLLQSHDGDAFVIMSPAGWSGFKDTKGHDIRYPDMQVYYYRNLANSIQSMTFVVPASLDETETLFAYLTKNTVPHSKGEQERVKTITSSLLSFQHLEPHDLVYSFEQVTGRDYSTMYDLLQHMPDIKESVAERIADFVTFIEENIEDSSEDSIQLFQFELGKTVLDMKSLMIRGRVPKSVSEYVSTHQTLERDRGCNGGGSYIETPYGARRIEGGEKFPNFGVCALYKDGPDNACISENRGHHEKLGLCMICPACDRAFESGKTFSEIQAIAQSSFFVSHEKDAIEVPEGSLFAVAAKFIEIILNPFSPPTESH